MDVVVQVEAMEAQWTQREMEALEEASEARKMADLFLKVLEWINVYPFFMSWNLCNLISSQIEPVRVLGQFETQPRLDFFSHKCIIAWNGQASEDAKKIIEKERQEAQVEIEAARATALRVQSALEEQSHSTLSSAEQEVCYKKVVRSQKNHSTKWIF